MKAGFEGERFAVWELGKGYSLPGLLAILAKQNQSVAEGDEDNNVEVRFGDEQPFHQRYYWELVYQLRRKTSSWRCWRFVLGNRMQGKRWGTAQIFRG